MLIVPLKVYDLIGHYPRSFELWLWRLDNSGIFAAILKLEGRHPWRFKTMI
jgi:hypothetical protein